MFLLGEPDREREGGESEGLRECIERFELATGDDALDWDTDKYFLDGLERLQNRPNVQWGPRSADF